MKDQYVDIPSDLRGKADPDDQWIKAQLHRIEPMLADYETEELMTRTMRKLVLELRTQRDTLVKTMNQIAAWKDGKVGPHMDEPGSASVARKALKAAGIKRGGAE